MRIFLSDEESDEPNDIEKKWGGIAKTTIIGGLAVINPAAGAGTATARSVDLVGWLVFVLVAGLVEE